MSNKMNKDILRMEYIVESIPRDVRIAMGISDGCDLKGDLAKREYWRRLHTLVDGIPDDVFRQMVANHLEANGPKECFRIYQGDYFAHVMDRWD
tara:strand:+ start:172 stop:453 length:282 start_codon:yes stop_codon:yes gene_type:complete